MICEPHILEFIKAVKMFQDILRDSLEFIMQQQRVLT